MEGLLERVLAGERGMQDLVGVAQPARPRREGDLDLRRAFLVGGVAFGAVMKGEHELIVGAAAAFRRSDGGEEPGGERIRSRQRGQELACEVLERLADAPDAR